MALKHKEKLKIEFQQERQEQCMKKLLKILVEKFHTNYSINQHVFKLFNYSFQYRIFLSLNGSFINSLAARWDKYFF